ncbi:Electron transport complex protein RnfG [uncultured Candidatus Thioglobus sp.]|nr:Electron transport complex protein RnfG [uncultured Candidatus Thioglobus sp.]
MALTQQATWEKIKFNEKQLLIKRLGELVDSKRYDNDILKDKLEKTVNLHSIQQTLNIYPAKKKNHIFAYLIEHTYPNGYNGNIRLLTAVDAKNQLLGVRVVAHKETPGLGDKIETRKSNWIKQFKGLSFLNLDKNQWKVKKDGGVFDAFTGATITPRAIVTATSDVLTLLSKTCLINQTGKTCSVR